MHMLHSRLLLAATLAGLALLPACSKRSEMAAASTPASAGASGGAVKIEAAPVTSPQATPSTPDVEALVQLIDDDLRANPNLSDADRRSFARQFAAEFAGIAADSRDDEPRRRAVEQAFTARYGTVDDVKAKECNMLRAQLPAIESRAKGTSAERLSEEERAALPAAIAKMQGRIASLCN